MSFPSSPQLSPKAVYNNQGETLIPRRNRRNGRLQEYLVGEHVGLVDLTHSILLHVNECAVFQITDRVEGVEGWLYELSAEGRTIGSYPHVRLRCATPGPPDSPPIVAVPLQLPIRG